MRKTAPLFTFLFVLTGLIAALPKSAAAQDDPPSRVARLNYVQGSVSYQVSGDKDWVQADPNRPLTTGDNLWADKDSRSEVHIGSTAIRMSSQTGLSFLTLDDRTVQLQLPQGTIEVHLRNNPVGDAFEIDTPNLAFTLTRAGEFRISTDPNGSSTAIVVREGEGEVTGGGESYTLRAGQQYTFNGTDELSYDASPEPGFDDFENWCQSRDERENNATAARYVSRDVDGYYDLDDYGDWESDADYGPVWIPRGVAVGWVPYHYGHWVWIAPWGWTWVDEEPWGFAPFHYGRWCLIGARWGWVPGPVVVRPVYAPALVAFVGGGGFSLSVSFGGGFAGVAWFPLGPRDVFVPAYRCSPHYVQVVNVTNTRIVNVTQVTNVYNSVVVNRNVTNVNYMYAHNNTAITAVSKETFVGARSVSNAAVRVTADQIDHARVVDASPVAPTRASYISASARVATAKPAVAFDQRPVVARLNPEATVNRRAPVYTNDSQPFSRPAGNQPGPAQGGNVQTSNRGVNNPPPGQQGGNNQQQPSRGGFKPFQPPAGGNNPQSGSTQARTSEQPQTKAQQNYKFAPPAKAKDENYDVHPPLNRQQQKPAAQPQHEEKSAPKEEHHSDSHH